MHAYQVRKWVSHVEEIVHDGGDPIDPPLIKAAVGVVIVNPFAGTRTDDLSSLTEPSAELGIELGRRAVALLGGRAVESYGKGGLVGVNGEQEHLVACITTTFGNALREQVGGGEAWISSATKVASAGASLDLPLAHKNALYVRSHYDSITVSAPDVPRPDEIFVVVSVATGGRPHNRVGGLKASEITGGGLV